MASEPPPFVLPETPIDRYSITYYNVERQAGRAILRECRAVYHVNSTWAEVCPDRADRHGVDFVDHWQIFSNGEFTGRSADGWDALIRRGGYGWDDAFATRAEAVAYSIEHLEACLADRRRQVIEIEAEIKRLSA